MFRPGRGQQPVTLTIRDRSGRLVRQFTSEAPPTRAAKAARTTAWVPIDRLPDRFDASTGMHRFILDVRYSGEPDVPRAGAAKAARPGSPKPGERMKPARTRPRFPAGPVRRPASTPSR